jgi:hypothetical protein
MPNNKENVSTTRGVVGGYFFSSPTTNTTDLPDATNYKTWVPGASWELQGYVPEDGFTESVSSDGGDELRDINLDIVDTGEGSYTETLEIGFMEMAKNPLATQYGHANVTDASGTITVDHNWGRASETRRYALLLVLKNGRRWVKYVPEGKVTSVGDFVGNANTTAGRTVTITYTSDENGSGCKDFIESNETS